jgi:membrane protease YdiL (CAAX protease family)
LSHSDNPQFEMQPPVGTQPELPASVLAKIDPGLASPLNLVPSPAHGENPVWSGWDVLLIALLTLGTMFIVELLTVIMAKALVYPHSSFGDVAQNPGLAILGEFLAYLAVAAYMIMLVQGKYHEPFWQAIRWNWPRNVALMLLLGMFTVSLDLLSRYLPMPKTTPFDQFFARPGDAYLMVVFAITFGPLMEELFFRGFLYPVLARWTGETVAVVLTALPFGLIHYVQYKSWAAVLVIGLVGVVLTTVRAVTKSVAASFLVHVGYNGTLMVLAALATDGFRHMEKAAVIGF